MGYQKLSHLMIQFYGCNCRGRQYISIIDECLFPFVIVVHATFAKAEDSLLNFESDQVAVSFLRVFDATHISQHGYIRSKMSIALEYTFEGAFGHVSTWSPIDG